MLALLFFALSSLSLANAEFTKETHVDELSYKGTSLTIQPIADVEIRNQNGEWRIFEHEGLTCQFAKASGADNGDKGKVTLQKDKVWNSQSFERNQQGDLKVVLANQDKKILLNCQNQILFSGKSEGKGVANAERNCQRSKGFFVFHITRAKPWIYRCFKGQTKYSDLKRIFKTTDLDLKIEQEVQAAVSNPSSGKSKAVGTP